VSWNDTRVGGTVGAGWETEIAPGWKARAEYRYTDFGSYTKTFNLSTSCSSCAAPSSGVSIDLKESFHTFRIGLGFDL
jgi:outer membrane immunogenic protein